MRRAGVYIAGVVLALASVGCESEPEPENEPTPRAISAECRDAFAAAEDSADSAEGREAGDEERNTYGAGAAPQEGSFLDLIPTLDACRSSQEWFEAYRGHRSEATAALPASQALRSLCTRTDSDSRPCQGIASPREEHPAP